MVLLKREGVAPLMEVRSMMVLVGAGAAKAKVVRVRVRREVVCILNEGDLVVWSETGKIGCGYWEF